MEGDKKNPKYFHLEEKKPRKICDCKMKDVENRRHLTFILSCNTKNKGTTTKIKATNVKMVTFKKQKT